MARKNVPLRIDPAVYDAIARWAHDDLRSVNAQIEVMLRDQLRRAGRLPKSTGELPRRGRPPRRSGPDPDKPA
ncbi:MULTISPECIES: hypothetical protein [Corynebacterium]|uniref:hypothetical protein n=1 Tax=Corynebacterium TaxID=1716 RepID=UPI0011AB6783|nr:MULTISPECIES: hypothetical protein [Corynebacterium]MDN5683712.1 hypothetical protein [Corynebacterium glyciniphilum]MDN6707330.1 hypothetical protein [Corynebacterium glyciniphilum]